MSRDGANSKLHPIIDKAFGEPIDAPAKSLFYKIGVFLTTFTMVLLPAAYFLIIVLVGYGIYRYHNFIREFAQARTSVDLENEIWMVRPTMYIPLIFGWVIVIFLLKPFLPRKKKKETPLYVVNQQNEPLLCLFIEQVCRHIKAPVPKRIELVMEPEISAAFQRGIFSFIRGDLTLFIGLPLFSGLTVRQIAGILAHELGRFRLKGGIRLTYLSSLIHGWFYHRVHNESTDEEPDWETSGMHYGRASPRQAWLIIVLFVKFFILLTRGILWLFLILGSAVSSFFSRQMKCNSDQLQIRVAGSRDFEATLYTMAIMKSAFERTAWMTNISWKRCVLVDNLPMLVKEEAKDIVANRSRKEDTINSILARETKLLDMEPSLRDRIARARQKKLAGICEIDVKSRMLLNDYDLLSKNLTRLFYEKNIKTNLDEKKIYLSTNKYQDYVLENKPIIL